MSSKRLPRHAISDEQWSLISDLFPVNNFKTGRRPRDRRQIMNAIFWIVRTGAPWRDLPPDFGPWSTVWVFFDRWTSDGTLERVNDRLRETLSPSTAPPAELWCVDGTSIRAARCSGGGGKKTGPGRARRSRSGAVTRWLRDENPLPV
ncbi:MAG TPA: IS5 family transposase [Roseibacterium sp.]|nr:IS5 family transposase [Roseibacterium sp.]